MPSSGLELRVLGEIRRRLAAVEGPLVLAVSGGADSMALLHAVHRVAPARLSAVATFDHGTGSAARRAVKLVRAEGDRFGVAVVAGGGRPVGATEARWRAARWRFLREVAAARGARVVTAHTRDDQVETVLMRVLRGSGARGLAGLLADTDIVRPLLALDRAVVRRWAGQAGVAFLEDPTNASRRHLRNRIRLDLLPALRGVRPDIDQALLDVSRRAAVVRRGLDAAARSLGVPIPGGGLAVATTQLAGYSRESLACLWPALAASVGVVLDRRGTERLAAFTMAGRLGGRVQVSGGWELHRGHDEVELRRLVPPVVDEQVLGEAVPVRFGAWRFSPGAIRADDPWTAVLPARAAIVVRVWRPGDRMVAAGGGGARRVKRFLSDAGITGRHRWRWPVVVSNGVVVWIPGVRRSDAATARPGRSEVSY
ncbi:MAG: tRNA lysidine(34) synthetase TilS, partial [Gemmatimonadaceae bacterium]